MASITEAFHCGINLFWKLDSGNKNWNRFRKIPGKSGVEHLALKNNLTWSNSNIKSFPCLECCCSQHQSSFWIKRREPFQMYKQNYRHCNQKSKGVLTNTHYGLNPSDNTYFKWEFKKKFERLLKKNNSW